MMAECLLNTRGNARIISLIRVSKGFDRDDEGGEAIRKQYVTRKLKINANDNRQLAAA